MRVLKYLLGAALIILLVVAVAAYFGNNKIQRLADQPLSLPQSQTLVVEPGSNFQSLLNQLEQQQLIDQPLLLKLYARQHNLAHRIKAGEYLLEPGLTHGALLQMLVQGRVKAYQVTLVEGQTVAQLIRAIQSHPQIEKTLEFADPIKLAPLLGVEGFCRGLDLPGHLPVYPRHQRSSDPRACLPTDAAVTG